MAIERRALFALSIAFTASLVGYPDLPPDIPPRAGLEGPFIGAPFVAFLLPFTAIAIWWMLASLHRPVAGSATRSMNAGAATVIFLSTFHVIMLIGFTGGRPWPPRILGIVVGLFLIVTGNDLPRVRQTPFHGDGPRRVRRLGGYLRVMMGVAVCTAGVLSVPWLTRVIVLAVAVEAVGRIGAAVVLSRRSAVVGIVLLCCCGLGVSASAQGIPPGRIEGLSAFIDATVPRLMAEGHVPGAAIAIVQEGRIVLLRGYGQSRLDDGTRVDPSRTVFRIGSVSKVFTSVAAMQLAERGVIDLRRDIQAYVPDLHLRYGASTHQLLTHTAGIDERSAIPSSTTPPDRLPSLADRLRLQPPIQSTRPGIAYSYSNPAFSLAGLLVESVSGVASDAYMADRIFSPLGMTATTAGQFSARQRADLAGGYRWTGQAHDSVPQRVGSTDPAGGISTTAADMGRFMLALLGDGSVDGGRILSSASVKTLLAPQYTPDPRIAPRGYAFLHWFTHGRRLQHHDGTRRSHQCANARAR